MALTECDCFMYVRAGHPAFVRPYVGIHRSLSLGNNQKSQGARSGLWEAEQLSWCSFWSNSLWQGWSCGLVHCPGGNSTDAIWRVLGSSDGISCWTPLKPQHSNPNPNTLDNQLWCIDLLTHPTSLIIPHRLLAFLESLMQSEVFHTFLLHFFQV